MMFWFFTSEANTKYSKGRGLNGQAMQQDERTAIQGGAMYGRQRIPLATSSKSAPLPIIEYH